jgi:DNA-binding IclR family transcriptional regulator
MATVQPDLATARGLQILECLATAPHGLPLGAICETVGIPKSAGHRILAAYVQGGYVRQQSGTGFYEITLRLPLIGLKYLATRGIHDVTQPVLDDLAKATGEYVLLGVADGDALIWIAHARGPQTALQYSPVSGPLVRLHCTASGTAWLAALPEDRAVEIVLKRGFDEPGSYHRNAPRSVAELLKVLAQVRARGFGMANESADAGINAIAIALVTDRVPEAPAIGTLSIAGPASRLPRKRLESFKPLLRQAAADICALWPLRPRGANATTPMPLNTKASGGHAA